MQHPQLLQQLKDVLGQEHTIINKQKSRRFRFGWRTGGGDALAVVKPQTLLSFYQTLQVCVKHNSIIIMQAANTGLTEGSTPSGDDYDRPIIIINTLAMNQIYLLEQGQQVLSFSGATLFSLENLLKPIKRTPHSVIGSSCLGASVVGGIANNSGGALIKRGPAYTEMALFARVDEQGVLQLVNHLGIELGETPEQILSNLMAGNFAKNNLVPSEAQCSDGEYQQRVRQVDETSPSRYNADPRRLFEASGCAGKLAVFAVRLDTFAVAEQEQTFYIGTNDPLVLGRLRREVLQQYKHLPEVGEYLHKDIFDISAKYGKDTFLSVKLLGTDRLPQLFALKGRVDAICRAIPFVPTHLTDWIMQTASRFFPQHLPPRILEFRAQYDHHLILKMSGQGILEAKKHLAEFFAEHEGDFFECDPKETAAAVLNRFAAAGAAMRYHTLYQKDLGDLLSLDIALRRDDIDWLETLPEELQAQLEMKLYYGHFFCHVFHQDYILKKGSDPKEVKKSMLELLNKRGVKYPAEHNVGHLYEAEKSLKEFYLQLDPTNTFNPGIGKTDKTQRNCSCQH
ncbi:D-lactate dehydrogenase [Paraglaciecola arctica]|uniref:Quinone-dependent D-lactate dehydrogenase n=1 Tax=Paraglaciecola arctica BSs20135 TaxID=493475 RepID=K6Z7Q8_9ALTE|nr:D-lactate dehydrogenase [Paraglaciecola arctica]GAC19475.1 D-lactate dehydrogenase [Paraglaciecola arctica BSs20135]